MGPLAAGVAYLVLYAAAVLALRGYPSATTLVGHVGVLLPPLALCVIAARRRRAWRGSQRLFWAMFAIGSGLWVVGHLGWAFDHLTEGHMAWLGWHSVFSICGAIGPLLAVLTRPWLGVRAHAVGSVSIGLASYGLLAVFAYAYFVLIPSAVLGEAEAQMALLGVVQVNRAALAVAMCAALWAAWHTPWQRTFLYLAVGTGAGLVLRAVTSLAIARGTYDVGTLYDLAWLVPFVSYAVAASEAPASPVDDGPIDPHPRVLPAFIAAIPVLLIPVVGYGTLFLQPLADEGNSLRALLTGLMTVAGLGLLTLRLAAQGTELQRADARLRLLAAATEQTADLILITRADGTVEHANEAFLRALGYTRAELLELECGHLMDPVFADAIGQIKREVGERGIWRGTLMRRRHNDSLFPAACTLVCLRDDGGRVTHYVSVERDITDEVRLREQLVHSERLSAIGELVAGVAHEINNPLQTIIGSVELMMEEHPGHPGRRDLEIVRREATRAGQIVRNLLSFVRRGGTARAPADLNALVRSTASLREFHLQQQNIALDLDLASQPLEVVANREEIQQVLLNLLLNAEQAILAVASDGGIAIRTARDGDEVFCEVADTGPGVQAELAGRIFEPFFTTKEVGEGTGLGLSISHGIAASHGGSLELRPAGRGACFRLTLPAAAPVATPEATGERRAVALVVDDELPIRKLLVRLLQRRGYETLEAETGVAALALATQRPPELVLCDVRMPGMTGPELYKALAALERSPRRFIFITGDRGAITGEPAADVPVLAKPFTAADLDAVLAESRVSG